MRALIIAGGFGTRMRPLTDRVPKSLLPVLNKPFLQHQLEQLAAFDVTDVTLLTGYRAEDFAPFVEAMRGRGVTLSISTEETPLDTAGAVRNAADRIDGTTLVLNADAIVAGLDWSAAIDAHRGAGAAATLVLVRLDDASGYGAVTFGNDKRVRAFEQLTMSDTGRAGWINAGNYVLEPRALDDVPAATPWSFEKQVFPALAEAGELLAYPAEGHWLDFGTPDRYLQGHVDVLDGKATLAPEGQVVTATTRLTDGTQIVGPVLLSHAPVGPGAVLGPHAVIGGGARIGAGATVVRSVIHAGADVGPGATVRDSIVGAGAQVPEGSSVVGGVLA